MSQPNPPLRAVGYRRVSMKDQVDGHSLDAQETNIRQFVAQQGWELVKIYTDAGLSAKKGSHRPALEQLMQDAQEGKFDVVIVDKIDRFYRHLNGLLMALDRMNQYGVSFASIKEKLDLSTPWGKLMLTVLGMLAEIYIDNLRQETRKGKLQRARKGLWNGNIPFGYCRGLCSQCSDPNGEGYCPDFGGPDKSTEGLLVPHPIDGQIVQRIFQLYLSGEHSDASITELLNTSTFHLADGREVRPRSKGTPGQSQSGVFGKDAVRGILTRVFYTGKIPYFGRDEKGKSLKRKPPQLFEGRHPALVDEATFQAVQQLRRQRATYPRTGVSGKIRVYPLTGVLYCGYCGGRFRGNTGSHGRKYYRDANKVEHKVACPQPFVRAEAIENKLARLLRDTLFSDQVFDKLNAVQRTLRQAEKRLERSKTLYLAGAIDLATFLQEKEHYEFTREALSYFESNTIMMLAADIRQQLDGWQSLSNLKKKRLFRLVLERAYVQGDTFVGLQPSVVFAPLLNSDHPRGEVGGTSGPDGIRTRDLRLDRAAC